jgi:hypothetical protein
LFDGGAAALELCDGIVLQFGEMALGDVLVGRNPAAVTGRPVGDSNEASTLLSNAAGRFSFGNGAQKVGNVLVPIAGKTPGLDPIVDKVAKRSSRPGELGGQTVHLPVTLVAQDKLAEGRPDTQSLG